MVRGTDGLLRLEMAEAGRQVVLDPLAELIWDLSDGSLSPEGLTQAAGRVFDRDVHKEEVFSALDFLADAGLIEERVAPPVAEGKVSRRSLLVQLAPVVGAGAFMMLGTSARAGGLLQNHTEVNSKESTEKEHGQKNLDRNLHLAEERAKTASSKAQIEIDKSHDQQNSETSRKVEADKKKIDHTGRYKVPPNHPLVGIWKHVTPYSTMLWTFSSADGTDLMQLVNSAGKYEMAAGNWKYTSTGPGAGVLETILGESVGKHDIRWISKDEFEFNLTIGNRVRFVRGH
jgi:hypothetical protein